MIHSFLSDRSMRVRVNKTMSDALKIKDGSPQGTLLGNLLFTLTTDMIEVDQNATNVPCQVVEIPRDQIAPCIDLEYLASTPIGVERTLSRLSEISDIHEHAYLRRTERILRYEMIFSDTDDTLLSRNGSYWEKEVPPPGHRKKRELISVKFIDDLTTASTVCRTCRRPIRSSHKTSLEGSSMPRHARISTTLCHSMLQSSD